MALLLTAGDHWRLAVGRMLGSEGPPTDGRLPDFTQIILASLRRVK